VLDDERLARAPWRRWWPFLALPGPVAERTWYRCR